ncbi:MAG: aminotransferase class III-fold pyridoxal phosphate-dependent enzyme [Sandaracinus sp.]|nr:aminotransferase class III-fold pyridoxal phosphate-dependent enzyme [Sandaracinus sp.]
MSDPFFHTWQAQRGAKPFELRGGEGVWLETASGRVLDFGALVYQVNPGHGHRRIVDAVSDQAQRLAVAPPNAHYPEKRELAERLLAKAPPGFTKVLFTLGGSDANENALKIARMVTGRYKAIARYRGYHGATFGAVSLSGDWRRQAVEPGLPGIVHVLDLDPTVKGTQIPRVLELEGNVGAVFLESVVGANGVLIPPRGYYEEVRAACDRSGALLVIDEVLAGFGRTGKYFGLEHWDFTPDMITCGKALTGGYGTLGAVLVHERVAERFEEYVLACGLTHHAHPIGVAAALETLKVYDDEKLVQNAAGLEATLRAKLEALRPRFGALFGEIRGLGLLFAIELRLDDAKRAAFGAALREEKLHAHLKGPKEIRAPEGHPSSALVLSPPLCATEEDLTEGVARIERALAKVV